MHLSWPHGTLPLDRPRLMGILNVTPDSFSDGGAHTRVEAAVAHGRQLWLQGADLIDVGGESTRPGSQPVPDQEQIRRVIPVIRGLTEGLASAAAKPAISVDTQSARVARAALDAGAVVINDVSAGRDPGMFALAAERQIPLVLMHMRGTPATMQENPTYVDVVAEVEAFLLQRAAAAEAAGVARHNLVLDVGIGFGKTREHNLHLLAALPRFVRLGYPLLLGCSRKRFMGAICQARDEAGLPRQPSPTELVGATCATTALGVAAGVPLFRVHDVQPNRQAAQVAWAIAHSRPPTDG